MTYGLIWNCIYIGPPQYTKCVYIDGYRGQMDFVILLPYKIPRAHNSNGWLWWTLHPCSGDKYDIGNWIIGALAI
jgi:hypothetical protein